MRNVYENWMRDKHRGDFIKVAERRYIAPFQLIDKVKTVAWSAWSVKMLSKENITTRLSLYYYLTASVS